MIKISLACFSCAIFAVAAAYAQAQSPRQGTQVHSIQLTEARDIAGAAAANDAISIMVKEAVSCSSGAAKDLSASRT